MTAPERPFVTVVTGLPRSGTSMAMQMLAAGGMPVLDDGHRPADPHNPRGYLEYAPVRRTAEDASWVEAAPGRAVKVVHLLVPLLPADRTYRVVLLRRPIAEVMASQNAMLGEGGALEDGGAALGHVFERQIRELAHWLREAPHCQVLELAYPDVVADPKAAAAALDRFLGGGLDVEAMARAVAPGLHRQREG